MKNILLLFFVTFSLSAAVASDIVVTTTAATNSSNNGQLHIQIDPSITDFPFQLRITYPSGYVHEVTLNTHEYTLTGLDDGDYIVELITASGCSTVVEINLQRCKYWKGKYWCFAIAEPAPVKADLLMVVDPGSGFNGSTDEIDNFSYELCHPDPSKIAETTLYNVFDASIELVTQTIIEGGTDYDVPEQEEIETDAMFVMKFDEEGVIEWVYHNYESEDHDSYEMNSGNSESSYEISDFQTKNSGTLQSPGKIFPNPATHSAAYQFASEEEGTATLLLTDMLGRQIKRESISLIIGNNTHQIDGLESISNGMYFLNVVVGNKVLSKERIIVQH